MYKLLLLVLLPTVFYLPEFTVAKRGNEVSANAAGTVKEVAGFSISQSLAFRGKQQAAPPIFSDTVPKVLQVPAAYPTIDSAMAFLVKFTLTDTVTIVVADGTYKVSKAIVLNHGNGDLIKVIGNPAKPANCRIIADTYHSAFVVNNGHSIALISGFTFIGQGDKVVPPFESGHAMDPGGERMGDGIAAYGGSFVKVSFCDFRKWLHGCSAWGGSSISADNCTASNNWDSGFFAYNNSSFFASNCVSTTSSSGPGGLGFGFLAEMSSSMFFQHCSASNNEQGGYYANKGSSMIIRNSSSTGNNAGLVLRSSSAEIDKFNVDGNGFGFYFEDNSSARVHNKISADKNTKHGICLTDNSVLAVDAILTSSNNLGSGFKLERGSRLSQIGGEIKVQDNQQTGIVASGLSSVYLKSGSTNSISGNGRFEGGPENNFDPPADTWGAGYAYIQTDSVMAAQQVLPDPGSSQTQPANNKREKMCDQVEKINNQAERITKLEAELKRISALLARPQTK